MPVTSLASNNNMLVNYEQSRGYDQISHALSNVHGLYGCSCNLLDVISVYSLSLGKLPGHFSYERPGYEATCDLAVAPVSCVCVTSTLLLKKFSSLKETFTVV